MTVPLTTTTSATTSTPAAGSVLGHLALHYRPGDEQPARRLLELLGFALVDNGPAPGRDGFCTVLLDGEDTPRADNVMFLSQMPAAQIDLERQILDALAADAADDDSAVGRYRALSTAQPEITSHIGVRVRSLAQLESVITGLEAAAAPGGELAGRIDVVKYRPRPGGMTGADDAAVAHRIAGSAAFDGDEPESFARHWVQCFVSTDLCGYGIFAFGSTFELDYVFDPFFREPVRFGS